MSARGPNTSQSSMNTRVNARFVACRQFRSCQRRVRLRIQRRPPLRICTFRISRSLGVAQVLWLQA